MLGSNINLGHTYKYGSKAFLVRKLFWKLLNVIELGFKIN